MSADPVTKLWSKACDHLQKVLPPDVYSRWIAVIRADRLEGDTLFLSVDNDFYQSWLEENYMSLIAAAVASSAEQTLQLKFSVTPPQEKPIEESTPVRKTIRERWARRSNTPSSLNSKFTFDTFIVGPSNTFAHAASLAVAQAPARAYNPLFVYGDVGLGKTHLMQAIGHHVLGTSRAQVCYISSETMMNEYIVALQNRTLVQYRKKYRTADLLLIDDIHFLANKEGLQEEFFHTFNALFDARKQVVMTSDRPAREITGLERRLVSRFEWGLVTELQPPDLETRLAILHNKQEQANTKLADDLLLFIAQNIRSNIRSLEGALIRAVSYASLTNQVLNLDSLRYLLRDTLEKENQDVVTFDSIQRAVAEFYDIRLADMTSKRRPQAVAYPRQVAMYLCRRMTRSSLPDIAGAFGKTHATVLYAYKTIDGRMDVDTRLRDDVSKISEKLGKKLC